MIDSMYETSEVMGMMGTKSRQSVHNAAAKHGWRSRRIGNSLLWNHADVDEFIADRDANKAMIRCSVKMTFLTKEEQAAFYAASTPRSRVTAVLGGDK